MEDVEADAGAKEDEEEYLGDAPEAVKALAQLAGEGGVLADEEVASGHGGKVAGVEGELFGTDDEGEGEAGGDEGGLESVGGPALFDEELGEQLCGEPAEGGAEADLEDELEGEEFGGVEEGEEGCAVSCRCEVGDEETKEEEKEDVGEGAAGEDGVGDAFGDAPALGFELEHAGDDDGGGFGSQNTT